MENRAHAPPSAGSSLRHCHGPLFSINPNSSLPEQPSTIGRFIETGDAPGGAPFSSRAFIAANRMANFLVIVVRYIFKFMPCHQMLHPQ